MLIKLEFLAIVITLNIMNKYIDMHSHILDGIDDGSRDTQESIEIVSKLERLGFVGVTATPHYIEGSSYEADNEEKRKHLISLQENLRDNKINCNIYLGNEIYICADIDKYIREDKIYPLNNTKYLLIELPFENEISSIDDYLFKLRSKGYIIIIAHPERYYYFQKSPDRLKEYIDMGIIFQCNYGSITGRYGKSAKKAIKIFLKKGYVHLLASDVHSPKSSFFEDFPKIIKKIIKIVGESKFTDLTYNNAYKILSNMKLDEM